MPSSVIKSFRHDPDTSVLIIYFQTGGVYKYFGVRKAVCDQMKASRSKGAFFTSKIRDRYAFEKLN